MENVKTRKDYEDNFELDALLTYVENMPTKILFEFSCNHFSYKFELLSVVSFQNKIGFCTSLNFAIKHFFVKDVYVVVPENNFHDENDDKPQQQWSTV